MSCDEERYRQLLHETAGRDVWTEKARASPCCRYVLLQVLLSEDFGGSPLSHYEWRMLRLGNEVPDIAFEDVDTSLAERTDSLRVATTRQIAL